LRVADGVAAAVVVEVGVDISALDIPFRDAVGPPPQAFVGIRAGVKVTVVWTV
jgi:hypothetical protein